MEWLLYFSFFRLFNVIAKAGVFFYLIAFSALSKKKNSIVSPPPNTYPNLISSLISVPENNYTALPPDWPESRGRH